VWLLDALPGVVDDHADDAGGDEAGGSAEDAQDGLDLVDAADDLVLLLLLAAVGVFVEEELIILVAGELAAVHEEGKEADGQCGPDGQKNRIYGHHCEVLRLRLHRSAAGRRGGCVGTVRDVQERPT
jgi:hypothetical protein